MPSQLDCAYNPSGFFSFHAIHPECLALCRSNLSAN
ncbi:hypothetical protein AHF37_04058 [Paragonimus kellicotti]|nr:hypothetical protein AHF37_04058 [Paragonimus kellicotti]